MVIVNNNYHSSQTVRVKTEKQLKVFDKKTLTNRPLQCENGIYTLTVAAGDGELLSIE